MNRARNFLLMTTAAALCAAPMVAFGQANTGGSSQTPTTTQTMPQQGPLGGTPGTASRTDGTPGNPPSTAVANCDDADPFAMTFNTPHGCGPTAAYAVQCLALEQPLLACSQRAVR